MAVSPYSHDLMNWSGPAAVEIGPVQVGTGTALTTFTAGTTGHGFNPYGYACIYDVLIHYSSITATAAVVVELYNTTAAGTQAANSYFSAPFSIATTSATPQVFSARKQAGLGNSGAVLLTPEIGLQSPVGDSWIKFCNTYVFKAGQIFSVRTTTNGGSSIADLCVTVLLCPSDLPFLTF